MTVSELGNVMGSVKGAAGAGSRGEAGGSARAAGAGGAGSGRCVAACDAEPSRGRFKSDTLISLLRLKLKIVFY